MTYAIAAFYRFVPLTPERVLALRDQLLSLGKAQGIQGLILLATEGINATICALPEALAAFKTALVALPEFADLTFKDSFSETPAFRRLTIQIREEIVTAELPGLYPTSTQHRHLAPKEWHALLERGEDEVVVVDTRNTYETKIGKFKGAVAPPIRQFSEFGRFIDENPLPQDKTVLIYCTGGIRCEKAILALEEKGYENVYQLDGGILNYFAEFPDGGAFEGECFLFDHRVAVDSKLQPSQQYSLCPHCGDPATESFACGYCKGAGQVCEACAGKPHCGKACTKNCAYHLRRLAQRV
ncbi:rhodanese-related sulfurtransferase [Armatimonas rosea]|uniref:tRNA uridine(34) hydroxylase n=1 Tax=Armatimonas rosea TaxID=685828 RepID=A0A7W9SWJ6_ARMRO|nr:rhodanese-like domain-containing protein [Armatimonas rosea]MBB6053249.1 UPF0176 protein [Armatimonas rosea]